MDHVGERVERRGAARDATGRVRDRGVENGRQGIAFNIPNLTSLERPWQAFAGEPVSCTVRYTVRNTRHDTAHTLAGASTEHTLPYATLYRLPTQYDI